MTNINLITNIQGLYEKIFDKNAINSEEIRIFVTGNPHPLRLLIENFIEEKQNLSINELHHLLATDYPLLIKLELAHELDTLITAYIENNLQNEKI